MPGAILFGYPRATIGPDIVCCNGILCIDQLNAFPTKDPWPSRQNPSDRVDPCDSGTAIRFEVRYLTCIPAFDPNTRYSAPSVQTRTANSIDISDIGFEIFTALRTCQSDWARKYGPARVTDWNPEQSGNQCGGVNIAITAGILNGCN